MTTVNIHAAKTNLSRLLEEVAAGAEIIIAKAGKPIARLAPLAEGPRRKRTLGLLAGQAVIPPAFDEPLPDEILAGFEGR
jgi:prevent-host-death family protein